MLRRTVAQECSGKERLPALPCRRGSPNMNSLIAVGASTSFTAGALSALLPGFSVDPSFLVGGGWRGVGWGGQGGAGRAGPGRGGAGHGAGRGGAGDGAGPPL